MKLSNTQDSNPIDVMDMDSNRMVWTNMLDYLLSPETSKEFKDKMNAKIMAQPDFEEDHLMKDSDLHDMARVAFRYLDERHREPYADLIANLPK